MPLSDLSSAAQIYTGDRAPSDPSQNTKFHQELLDFLIDGARSVGWSGAEICDYDRFQDGVSIGIAPGESWPTLDDVRAWRTAHRNDPPRRVPELAIDNQGQGSLAL